MNKTLHTVVVAVGSLAGLVLLNVGFLFLLLGFLPTVVAYFVDETPKMDLYKTVRAANLAGMLPTLMLMFQTSYPAAALQVAMSDPRTWFMTYGGAGCGWLLIWICRWVAYISLLAAGEARITMLESAQKDMLKEWGDELKEYVITTEQSKPAT